MTDTRRWRGLKDLVRDAVDHGATAIERVHLETARRPFSILEQVPSIAGPVQSIHQVHDAFVSTGYASVRTVTGLLDQALDTALDAIDAIDALDQALDPEADSGPR